MDLLALADRLPDDPQHLFVQAALRWPGARARGTPAGLAVGHPGSGVVGVLGHPEREALLAAATDTGQPWAIVADRADRARLEHLLPQARFLSATQWVRPPDRPWPAAPAACAVFTSQIALHPDWPIELRAELTAALTRGCPASAALVDGQAVAVAYAVHLSPAWWDVSVDCLPAFQRRGLASAAFVHLAARLAATGRRPIWGCLDANEASRRMAKKLGFEEVWPVVVVQGR